jgi:hypothetical protein
MIRGIFTQRSACYLSFPASLREILNRTSEGFGMRDYRDAVARLGQ